MNEDNQQTLRAEIESKFEVHNSPYLEDRKPGLFVVANMEDLESFIISKVSQAKQEAEQNLLKKLQQYSEPLYTRAGSNADIIDAIPTAVLSELTIKPSKGKES